MAELASSTKHNLHRSSLDNRITCAAPRGRRVRRVGIFGRSRGRHIEPTGTWGGRPGRRVRRVRRVRHALEYVSYHRLTHDCRPRCACHPRVGVFLFRVSAGRPHTSVGHRASSRGADGVCHNSRNRPNDGCDSNPGAAAAEPGPEELPGRHFGCDCGWSGVNRKTRTSAGPRAGAKEVHNDPVQQDVVVAVAAEQGSGSRNGTEMTSVCSGNRQGNGTDGPDRGWEERGGGDGSDDEGTRTMWRRRTALGAVRRRQGLPLLRGNAGGLSGQMQKKTTT